MDHVSARSLLRLPVLLGLLTSTLLMGCDPCDLVGQCGGSGGSGGAGGSGGSGGGTPISPPCDGKRWIGIKPSSPMMECSDFEPPNWKGEPLFQTSPGGFLPESLARYCLFTWAGQAPQDSPSAADVQALLGMAAASPGLERIDEDCTDVWPHSLGAEVALEQRRWIHDAAGGVASLPPATLADAPMKPVRLAILDTAPEDLAPFTSGPLPPMSTANLPRPGEHGELLAYLGRDLGCPQNPGSSTSACPVHPETVLAMRDGGPDPANPNIDGALYGRKGDLARGVFRTIDDWRRDVLVAGGGAEARLVLNISGGWEDHSDEKDSKEPNNCHVEQPGDLSAPARSVHDAIEVARCHGAAVLAAAGNATGGNPSHDGLLCPAYFMRWDAPTDKACSALVDPEFATAYNATTSLTLRPAPLGDDPLVTAVGAVDYGDEVLAPHRPMSLPPLVGPGAFAAAYGGYFTDDVEPIDSTPPVTPPATLSGTSVGTLFASTVTAAVWAYEPEVGADVVAGHVYMHAVALDQPATISTMIAEQHRPNTPNGVKRASLCRALKGINVLDPMTQCKDLDPHPGTERLPQNPMWTTATADLWASSYGELLPPPEISSAEPTNTPLFQLDTVAAGLDVIPTPVYPTCTTCVIKPADPGSILYVDLSSNAASLFLVKVGAGGTMTAYGISAGLVNSGAHPLGVSVVPTDRFFLQWSANGLAAFSPLAILH